MTAISITVTFAVVAAPVVYLATAAQARKARARAQRHPGVGAGYLDTYDLALLAAGPPRAGEVALAELYLDGDVDVRRGPISPHLRWTRRHTPEDTDWPKPRPGARPDVRQATVRRQRPPLPQRRGGFGRPFPETGWRAGASEPGRAAVASGEAGHHPSHTQGRTRPADDGGAARRLLRPLGHHRPGRSTPSGGLVQDDSRIRRVSVRGRGDLGFRSAVPAHGKARGDVGLPDRRIRGDNAGPRHRVPLPRCVGRRPGLARVLLCPPCQVVRGGEPDEFGFSLTDVRPPNRLSYFGSGCACGRTVLLYELWERRELLDLFAKDTDLSLRTVMPDCAPPLPDSTSLVEEHTIMIGIG